MVSNEQVEPSDIVILTVLPSVKEFGKFLPLMVKMLPPNAFRPEAGDTELTETVMTWLRVEDIGTSPLALITVGTPVPAVTLLRVHTIWLLVVEAVTTVHG